MVAPKTEKLEWEIIDPLQAFQEPFNDMVKAAVELEKQPNAEKKAALLMKARVFRVSTTAIRTRSAKMELDFLRLVNRLEK